MYKIYPDHIQIMVGVKNVLHLSNKCYKIDDNIVVIMRLVNQIEYEPFTVVQS